MADLDYQRDMHIDESGLDVEWLSQPSLMMKYCKELASAEREVARLKEKKSVVEAELDRDIRISPKSFDIKDSVKVTEAVIHGALVMAEEYQEVVKELIDAQYEVNMLGGAVKAIQQRKDALQDLVKLHGQRYFAGPNVPRDITQEVKNEHSRKEANAQVKIKRRTS